MQRHSAVIDEYRNSAVIVTIAREIVLSNPFENMGAQLLREVASKTNDGARASDGA